MSKPFPLVLLMLLMGEVKTAQGSCNGTTQYEMRGLCCDKCPPGSFRVAWCDVDSPTRCQPCPEGTCNAEFNVYPVCDHCTRCHAGLRQVMIEDSTPTRNRRCGCQEDQTIARYSEGDTLFWCCPNCPAGMEAQKQCSYKDFATPCSACPPGTFSDGLGAPCRNCTRCDVDKSPCTNTRDAVCIGTGPDGSANGKVIPSTATLAGCLLLSAAAAAVLLILRGRRTSVANTDGPRPCGASSPQHEKEKDLESSLNPDECDTLNRSSSVFSGIDIYTSESLLFSPPSKDQSVLISDAC